MQEPIPNPLLTEEEVQSTTAHNQHVYIRVRRDLLTNPSTNPLTGHLYLFEGKIDDVRRYAGTTAGWVIKIAHLVCSPRGVGQVYFPTTFTSQYWYGRDKETDWRQVHPDDPLLPGIYEFDSNVPIYLSRLGSRQKHSKTSSGSKSSSSTFRQGVLERDGRTCVVTGAVLEPMVRATHFIPKRMGTEGAKAVVTEFVGEQAAMHVHKFHPMIGLALYAPLEQRINMYILGFHHNTDDTYTLHNFDVTDLDTTFDGSGSPRFASRAEIPRLHLFQVTLTVHDGPEALPPKGVLDWHYLQCVAKQFATQEYKEMPAIYFPEFPCRTVNEDSDYSDDSDDEFEPEDYDGVEPPYPTYNFDRSLAEEARKLTLREKSEDVASWAASQSDPSI